MRFAPKSKTGARPWSAGAFRKPCILCFPSRLSRNHDTPRAGLSVESGKQSGRQSPEESGRPSRGESPGPSGEASSGLSTGRSSRLSAGGFSGASRGGFRGASSRASGEASPEEPGGASTGESGGGSRGLSGGEPRGWVGVGSGNRPSSLRRRHLVRPGGRQSCILALNSPHPRTSELCGRPEPCPAGRYTGNPQNSLLPD